MCELALSMQDLSLVLTHMNMPTSLWVAHMGTWCRFKRVFRRLIPQQLFIILKWRYLKIKVMHNGQCDINQNGHYKKLMNQRTLHTQIWKKGNLRHHSLSTASSTTTSTAGVPLVLHPYIFPPSHLIPPLPFIGKDWAAGPFLWAAVRKTITAL